MSSDGINCYTYNDANQLSQVKNCTTDQVIAQYVYDYQGNRIEKKIYNGGSLQKTVYSPDKTYETVKQATSSATTGIWTTGSASDWAAVIVSFNSAGSTPSLVQKNKGFNGGTGSVATSFTSNVTTGHTIVVMTITASASNLDTTSVTDNESNTYTQIGTTQHTPGNAYIRMWYAKNVTGGSVTVTAHQSGSASGCLMELLEYSGLSTTAPADQSASATGNSTSPSGGSITPTSNNALVISAFTDDNSDNVSITGTSGYTVEESDLINSTSSRNGIEDIIQTSGATLSNTSYYYVNDELAAKKNPDGSKYYYLSDNLGSTSVLINQSGTTTENSTYYPFGQIRSGGTQSKYLYTGQENDSETNLDYYNARYYDPSIMHFTQPDSELPNVYDPQQLNRYSYARNNPMTVTDPTGHWDIPILDNIISAGFAVYDAVRVFNNPRDVTNWVALAADTAAIVVPGLPDGSGLAVRAGVDAFDVARGVEKGADVIEAADKGAEAVHDSSAISGIENLSGGGLTGPSNPNVTSPYTWPGPDAGPQILNNRLYTEHALERMMPRGLSFEQEVNLGTTTIVSNESRGIPPSVVENAIENGTAMLQGDGTLMHQYDNVKVVTDILNSRVITVMTGR